MMSETAAERPAFRDALKRHRCLIPADDFFEWKKIAPNRLRKNSIEASVEGVYRQLYH